MTMQIDVRVTWEALRVGNLEAEFAVSPQPIDGRRIVMIRATAQRPIDDLTAERNLGPLCSLILRGRLGHSAVHKVDFYAMDDTPWALWRRVQIAVEPAFQVAGVGGGMGYYTAVGIISLRAFPKPIAEAFGVEADPVGIFAADLAGR